MFGESYKTSWWGNANESNSWGFIYPLIADGSNLFASITKFFADTIKITSDQTEV